MSIRNLNLKTGFIHAPYYNGVGRFVLQCSRITIKFCKEWASSNGAREWIRHDALNFAKANPSIVLYLKPRRHRSPIVISEYLNGDRHWMSLYDLPYEEIAQWIESFRSRGSAGDQHYKHYQKTTCPSIQGVWTPFTHKHPLKNLMTFPNAELSSPSNMPPSTTQMILEMYGKAPVIPKDEN